MLLSAPDISHYVFHTLQQQQQLQRCGLYLCKTQIMLVSVLINVVVFEYETLPIKKKNN